MSALNSFTIDDKQNEIVEQLMQSTQKSKSEIINMLLCVGIKSVMVDGLPSDFKDLIKKESGTGGTFSTPPTQFKIAPERQLETKTEQSERSEFDESVKRALSPESNEKVKRAINPFTDERAFPGERMQTPEEKQRTQWVALLIEGATNNFPSIERFAVDREYRFYYILEKDPAKLIVVPGKHATQTIIAIDQNMRIEALKVTYLVTEMGVSVTAEKIPLPADKALSSEKIQKIVAKVLHGGD
jgi:hypothetical protein